MIRQRMADHIVAISSVDAPRELPSTVRILFVPLSEGWNDFGFKVRCKVGLRQTSGEFHWVYAHLAFRDQNNTSEFVTDYLQTRNLSWVYPIRITLPFASLLENIEAYQLSFSYLGNVARNAAIESRDVALHDARAVAEEFWPGLTQSEVFQRAFMRRSEASFAYEHAENFFVSRSLSAEDARQDFFAEVRIGGRDLNFDFKFGESPVGKNRIAVLIGKNGCGKTTSLLRLSVGLADRHARYIKLEPTPVVNQIVVFAHSRSLARFRRSATPSSAIQVIPLDPTIRSARDKTLVAKLARIIRVSGGYQNLLTKLCDLLDAELNSLLVMVPVKVGSTKWSIDSPNGALIPLRSFGEGGEQARLDSISNIDQSRSLEFIDVESKKSRQLSWGQDVFVSFAVNALNKIGTASVILIDEPENFLHPNLISKFVRLLHQIVERTSSIAIVATHSPFVVREVPSSQVHIIGSPNADEGAFVSFPRMQTFGANVGAIADAIFGDDMVDGLAQQLLHENRGQSALFAWHGDTQLSDGMESRLDPSGRENYHRRYAREEGHALRCLWVPEESLIVKRWERRR